MFQLRRRGQITYEDLLREMEAIEHQLLGQDSALAMNLMVLDAKIRERFNLMDLKIQEKAPAEDDVMLEEIALDDVRALIPRDIPMLPTTREVNARRRGKKTIETVGLAAVFALATALGVFGLASVLQLALAWAG